LFSAPARSTAALVQRISRR